MFFFIYFMVLCCAKKQNKKKKHIKSALSLSLYSICIFYYFLVDLITLLLNMNDDELN